MSFIVINALNHDQTPYANEKFFEFLTFAGIQITSTPALNGSEVEFHVEGYDQLQCIRKVLGFFSKNRFLITLVSHRRILSQVVESNEILQTISVPRIEGIDVNFEELFYNHKLIFNVRQRPGIFAIYDGMIYGIEDISENEYTLLSMSLYTSASLCLYSNSSEHIKVIQFKNGNKFLVRQNFYDEKYREQEIICELIKKYYMTDEIQIKEQYIPINGFCEIDDDMKQAALTPH